MLSQGVFYRDSKHFFFSMKGISLLTLLSVIYFLMYPTLANSYLCDNKEIYMNKKITKEAHRKQHRMRTCIEIILIEIK